MGKKYIVEIGRLERLYKAYVNGNGKPDLTWLSPEVDLTPYTEPDLEQAKDEAYNEGYKAGREVEKVRQPDLEQVKADAYLKGLNDGQGVILASTQNNAFNDGYKKCLKDFEQIKKEAYEKGYADAKCGYENGFENGIIVVWEAVRKIGDMTLEEQGKIFNTITLRDIVSKFTASEVIEKLKVYEEDAEIKVGDEVITASGKAVVTGVGPVHFEYDNADGSHGFDKVKNVKKTGRHFSEIAAVFEKMRER